MRKNLIWVALAALLLPILLRVIWFYPGMASRPEIPTPDYGSLAIPQPPLETQGAQEVSQIESPGGTVLVDYSHANQFQPAEIESLKDAIEQRGGRLEFNEDVTMLENSLRYASAYVLISPSIGFTASEIQIIHGFVERGGRLAVFTDATRGVTFVDFFTGMSTITPDAKAVNPLLAGFDISVNNDYLYNLTENEGNFRNVFFEDFGKNELTFGLDQVAFYGTHSVESDRGLILFLGEESTLSSITDAHSSGEGGAALSEDGNVVVFGDFTFLTQMYQNVADNATLIANIADFVLGGERTITLANFPYLFSGKRVHVLPTSDVQMTAEMVGALGRLQTSLQARNISLQVTNEELDENDSIVLGTYSPTDDLARLIEPFDISMEEFSQFIEVRGLGNVGRSGNGLLLFNAGEEGNTLILLANSTEDLISLLDGLADGQLDNCLLQSELAVCSIGFGGSFSDEPTEVPATEPAGTEESTDGSVTPAPVLTPTPPAGG